MDSIDVVGISWRHRRASTLAEFTIPKEERETRLPALAAALGVRELVYVATCNRVEVVFASDGRTPFSAYRRRVFAALTGREPNAGEADHTFRAWQGEGAVEHLFLVAAGLDSARVGESEVAGQMREALELSRRLGLVGPRLDPAVSEALKVSKKVKPLTEGRIGKVSLAEVAVRRVLERLDRAPGAVALVGVSPMTEQCARELAARGAALVIVNRSLERAEALAAEVGAASRSLDAFRAAPDAVAAVVVATGSREPVFARADLERLAARSPGGHSPLVIDLAVPPNVAPEDAAAADVPRVGMDEISADASEDRGRVLEEFVDVRAAVDAALTDLRRQTAERLVGPMIAELRQRYRHTALEGVERLFEKDLKGLGGAERDAVVRWAETLARRFAHLPSVGLRELAFQSGPSAVEAFFAATDPALARDLHLAAERAGIGAAVEPDAA